MTPANPSESSGTNPALGRDFRGLLGQLVKLQHITGGFIVAPDGLLIAAELPREIQAEPQIGRASCRERVSVVV